MNLSGVEVERFGFLIAVQGAWTSLDAVTPQRPDTLCLQFQERRLVVVAVAEDHSIRLCAEIPVHLPAIVDLSEMVPWVEVIGLGMPWIWSMTNHRGYQDGFQVAFTDPERWQEVQLMCEASSLTVRRVTGAR